MHEPSHVTSAGDIPDSGELREAARAWGIETDYWDIWGQQHHASDAVELAILGSLGVDARTRASLALAGAERSLSEWLTPLAPTLLLTRGYPQQEIRVSMPEACADKTARLELQFEDGTTSGIEISLAGIPVSEETLLNGQRFVRKHIRLPDDLALGYHRLSLAIADRCNASARLIVCPDRTYQPAWLDSGRAAGIAIGLYGVRSERNWGCGDTTDLKVFIDWAAEQAGVGFVGLNPLHAIANRQPYNTSPYLPNSVFYRNPIYLDVEQVADFPSCAKAVALLHSPAVEREVRALRAAPLVEYERVYRLKLRFLKLLFRDFLAQWTQETERARELREYVEREGVLLHRFAVHEALGEAIHRKCPEVWNWRSWPEQYRDPDSAATRDFANKHWRKVLFHKYVQWQLDVQLESAQAHARNRSLSIGLYHDLALATDRFGADLWAHREFFIEGCRVGAPPDAFSPKGQDWAFPPPNSDRHMQDGYRLFAESIRKNSRHGGALRIDHVMRFFRLYWIPDGFDATQGTYVRERFQDLLRILALESTRQKIVIVGEDLGTVPNEIREMLDRFGILGYRLLYFEKRSDGQFRPQQEYPRDALVSATTPDLPTLAGFWLGRDIDARRDAHLLADESAYQRIREERAREKQKLLELLARQGLLPDWFPANASAVPELTGELHNAIVGLLASTPSKLMVLNQEDLLKQTEQPNLPGTTVEYPNWRHKMDCTVEELWSRPEIQAFTRMFRSWLERAGRLNTAVT
jgi:4-alpha-glucanotransferase